MKKNKFIVIVGCGRLGSYLGETLSKEGNYLVIIDDDEKSFEQLSTDFGGFKVIGDATHLNVLKKARISDADVLITTTEDDNINLMVAQIGKKIFKVDQVIARIYDPKRKETFNELQIDTVCPTLIGAENFIEQIKGNEK